MVDILYILKDKLLPIKGVPRKAEFIQQNRTEQNGDVEYLLILDVLLKCNDLAELNNIVFCWLRSHVGMKGTDKLLQNRPWFLIFLILKFLALTQVV